MPILDCLLLEGRTPEQKKKFVEAVTKASIDTLGCPAAAVTVIIREVRKDQLAHAGVLVCDEKK